jgi:hypothetical protein
MSKRYLTALLLVGVLLDLALTFWQNYQFPLDGDLVAVVFPSPSYSAVLHDPFGWTVLTKNAHYAAPNRFFAHAAMYAYWRYVPLWLHAVASPISSLYAASALFTTTLQAALLFLLAGYIRRASGMKRGVWGFWVAVALLVPVLQTQGYFEQMGITNIAVTYTFFYTLPLALLLLLLWPFFGAACQRQPLQLSAAALVPLVGLMLVIAFNGVIATAAIAVLLFCIGAWWLWSKLRSRASQPAPGAGANPWLSGQAMGLLGLLAGLCLYSMYIGQNNVENNRDHSLWQLYQLLPHGVWVQLTAQKGLQVVLALLLINGQLIRRLVAPSPERRRVLLLLRWVGVFSVLFVLLLPFGGYRSYRPLLLRNDSISPILLAVFFGYGLSTYFLLFQLAGRWRTGYLVAVCAVGAFFMQADATLKTSADNGCQRWKLDQLARATQPIEELSTDCNVLTWIPLTEYHGSEIHAQMLQYWGITKKKQLFYQK